MGTMYAQGSDVGEFPNSTSSDNSTEFERSGSTVTSITNNTSDTASSESSNTLRVEGSSAGSPYQKYQVGAVTSFSTGLDNTDDDRYKINRDPSGSVSPTTGTNLMSMGEDDTFFNQDSVTVNHIRTGSTVQLGAINNATTGDDSGVRITARTDSETADAYLLIDVTRAASPGSNSWKVGSNGGNDGSFEFRNFVNAGSPSIDGTLRQNINRSGQVTFPTTACFLGFLSASTAGITGAGTTVTVPYDSEQFDQNSNFDIATGVFTAPVTGRYSFQFNTQVGGLAVANNGSNYRLTTSNRNYRTQTDNPGAGRQIPSNIFTYKGAVIADMDAADTAFVEIRIDGGAGNTVTISGGVVTMVTFFSGKLAA